MSRSTPDADERVGPVGDGPAPGRRELNTRRTRARLIAAAREIFDRDGFLDSRITDITERADVAHGSFYNYFASKEEVLLAVLDEVHEEAFLGGSMGHDGDEPLSARARIDRTNREYYDAYRRNARILAVEEQLTVSNEVFAERRNDMWNQYVRRAASAISAWQRDGVARRDIDAQWASELLCSMVERWIHMKCVFGVGGDPEDVLPVMLEIWAVTLGLEP